MWSPFRYPGGKTWLVPTIRRWLRWKERKPDIFIEPFAGGGIISLTVAFEKLAGQILMVELDDEISSVWEVILGGGGEWLANEIRNFDFNLQSVNEVLAGDNTSMESKAFRTILKNRVYHGGIIAPGSGMIKNGENGKGLASRWYPNTLSKRILSIHHVRNQISFIQGDGLEIIKKYAEDSSACFFIDPPYTASKKRAGARLYKYFEVDHELLYSYSSRIKGDFLMTYDDAVEIENLAYQHDLLVRKIKMKNTHHAEMEELLISSGFAWLPDN
jgi:DNA adenine methylase